VSARPARSRPRARAWVWGALLAALSGCGAVLGIEEKDYAPGDGSAPAQDPSGGQSADGAPAPPAPVDQGGGAPDAAPAEGCGTCPACQTCGRSGACVPAPAGSACDLPHATARCDGDGACAVVACTPGYMDCTADPGCETTRSAAQCASCGTPCAPEHVVHAICGVDGTCTYDTCAPFSGGPGRYLDCDGDAANGCESSPNAPSTCGACGTSCATRCAKMGMTYVCKPD